ncbi:hypothetical protein MMC17_007188 [Xylographa soralifera]|nr:hypothetical protein [Xylographa soralifera]
MAITQLTMHYHLLIGISFAVLCLINGAAAAKVIGMDTFKAKRHASSSAYQKRATISGPLSETALANAYYLNITIGTPGQSNLLEIDTGSSDTWVLVQPDLAEIKAHALMTVDPTMSTSFVTISDGTFITAFEDGSGTSGDFFTDNIKIGGVTVKTQQMGLTLESTSNAHNGLVGLGFDLSEAGVSFNGTQPYPNLVDTMVNQSLINAMTYSIWLNDLSKLLPRLLSPPLTTSLRATNSVTYPDTGKGSILFGGIDTAKFTGPLLTLDMSPDQQSGIVSSMSVTFTSLSINDTGTITTFSPPSFAAPVVLDTGTSFTFLDSTVALPLINYVGAVPDPNFGYVVPCLTYFNYPASLTFGFGGPTGPRIVVPFSELLSKIDAPYTFPDGSQACVWGIQPTSEQIPINIFGDTFLRSAYVVFDLDNLQISLAQTDFNSTTSNVLEVEVGGGPENIPSATVVTGAVVATQSANAKTLGAAGAAQITAPTSLGMVTATPTASLGLKGKAGVTGTATGTTASHTPSNAATAGVASNAVLGMVMGIGVAGLCL